MAEKEDIAEQEKELLQIVGKIAIYDMYAGGGPTPKQIQDNLGKFARALNIEEAKIKEAFAYAREQAEMLAFGKSQRKKVGFKSE
jgi:hypothetical protein